MFAQMTRNSVTKVNSAVVLEAFIKMRACKHLLTLQTTQFPRVLKLPGTGLIHASSPVVTFGNFVATLGFAFHT